MGHGNHRPNLLCVYRRLGKLHTGVHHKSHTVLHSHHNSNTSEAPLPSHLIAGRSEGSSALSGDAEAKYTPKCILFCAPGWRRANREPRRQREIERELTMRSCLLLLIALPGWVWGYLSPAPLSGRPRQQQSDRKLPSSSQTAGTSSHAQRCRPLFRYRLVPVKAVSVAIGTVDLELVA